MLNKTLGLALVLSAVACGQVPRASAVTSAATASCNRYDACDNIGENKAYNSFTDCMSDQHNSFNNKWSSSNSKCNEIETKKLDICINSLETAQCGSAIDFLSTALTKCDSTTVCGS